MGYENSAGIGVNNHYGARTTGGAVGQETRDGSVVVVRIDLTGQSINDGIGGFVPPVVIPKGAKMEKFRLRVDEAFVVTGTSPTVRIGAEGSETTNGLVITEAELENVGTKTITSTGAGTWAVSSSTGTTAAAKVSFGALGGTNTPAVASTAGKATLFIEYIDLAKA
jgi:hypothetical protein